VLGYWHFHIAVFSMHTVESWTGGCPGCPRVLLTWPRTAGGTPNVALRARECRQLAASDAVAFGLKTLCKWHLARYC